MAVERVWLTHPDIAGSTWYCPVDAVDDWKKAGYVDGDEPAEVNPAIETMLRHRAETETAPAPASRRRNTKNAGDEPASTPEGSE